MLIPLAMRGADIDNKLPSMFSCRVVTNGFVVQMPPCHSVTLWGMRPALRMHRISEVITAKSVLSSYPLL